MSSKSVGSAHHIVAQLDDLRYCIEVLPTIWPELKRMVRPPPHHWTRRQMAFLLLLLAQCCNKHRKWHLLAQFSMCQTNRTQCLVDFRGPKDFLSPGNQICKGKGNAALSMHQRIATSSWRPGIHLWYCKRGGGVISENSSKFGNPIVPKSSVWYFQQNRRRHIVKDRLLHFAFTAKLHPSVLNVEQSLTNNEIIVGTLLNGHI